MVHQHYGKLFCDIVVYLLWRMNFVMKQTTTCIKTIKLHLLIGDMFVLNRPQMTHSIVVLRLCWIFGLSALCIRSSFFFFPTKLGFVLNHTKNRKYRLSLRTFCREPINRRLLYFPFILLLSLIIMNSLSTHRGCIFD